MTTKEQVIDLLKDRVRGGCHSTKFIENGDDTGYCGDMPIGAEREGYIYVEGRYYLD